VPNSRKWPGGSRECLDARVCAKNVCEEEGGRAAGVVGGQGGQRRKKHCLKTRKENSEKVRDHKE